MEPQTIFVYVTSFIMVLIAYFIPKKMTTYDIYATSLFATLFGILVDLVLAVKFRLYFLDSPGIQFPPLIGQVVLYATTSIILLNLFPYDKSIKWKLAHIFGFTLFAIVF